MRNKIAKSLKRLAKEETTNEVPEISQNQTRNLTLVTITTYPARKHNYKAKKRAYMRLNRNQRTAFNHS